MSVMLAGKAFGCLSLSFMGDLFGLKSLLVSNLFLSMLGMIITFTASTLSGVGVGLFWMIFGVQNSGYCTWGFLAEKVSEPQRSKYMIIIQMAYGLGVLLNPLWVYLSNHWSTLLFIFFLIPLIFTTVAMVSLVTDTPICLVNRYTAKEALEAFRYIAKVNQIENF
jgi:MFS family permease